MRKLPLLAVGSVLASLFFLSQPGHGSFELEGKVLLAVGHDGVMVVDPWRRTIVRKWSEHEVHANAAFSPDARWMAEVDRNDKTVRVIDLERREHDKDVLSGSDYSPIAALFGEDASKLWIVAATTKSIFEISAPTWKMGRNLPLEGAQPSRAWRCGSRGYVFQPPNALTAIDLKDRKISGTLRLSNCQACLTDPAGDAILAACGGQWLYYSYGQIGASWKAPALTDDSPRVCLAVSPGKLPQIVMLDPSGSTLTGFQAQVGAAPRGPVEPSLDAYVPADVPKVAAIPDPNLIPPGQLIAVWSVPLPGNFSSVLASPDGTSLFLGQQNPPQLLVLNGKSHQAIARLRLPFAPRELLWP